MFDGRADDDSGQQMKEQIPHKKVSDDHFGDYYDDQIMAIRKTNTTFDIQKDIDPYISRSTIRFIP